jgi:hypothetical protein
MATDEIRQPKWQLRQLCPVCEQSGLVLWRPECSHIGVICAEEGSRFQSVHAIAAESAVDPKSAHCPQCGRPLLSAFRDATVDQIPSAGLGPTDYE